MWNRAAAMAIIICCCLVTVRCQFYECHDDPSMTPDEGIANDLQFSWLGALQYIHVKNGTPHYFRVPRVVLISRQFVLSTAIDASRIPIGYALGNVAFTDYERDEAECGISVQDLAKGAECEPAILLMPIADVLLHPEYKHFEVKNSIALLKLIKPVKSSYMLPACIPFKNWLMDKKGRQIRGKIIHVDFNADVPRDFTEEEKEVTILSLLPKELCYMFDPKVPENTTKITRNRMICTTGCGFHSGAPTLVHEHTGHWSLVALATGANGRHFEDFATWSKIHALTSVQRSSFYSFTPLLPEGTGNGGPPCPDALRARRPSPPPYHIVIYPYVPWITAAITGKAIGYFAKDDPFGFTMPRVYDEDIDHVWLGHWWMGGARCFDRGYKAEDMFKFYHELFSMKPDATIASYITYHLEIHSPQSTSIICVKVGLPYRYGKPQVSGLDSAAAKVRIPVIKFHSLYRFQVEAWAYNLTMLSDSDDYSDVSESMQNIK